LNCFFFKFLTVFSQFTHSFPRLFYKLVFTYIDSLVYSEGGTSIEKDPNSPQAIKAVKKLVEDFANPEEFKKRCIEAKSELKEVNDLLGKITKQYEKLKNQSSQEESTLITLENMIKHFKEKIHTLEHAFGRETKAYLQYLETRLEVGHDAPEEVIEDKLREKIKMSKGEEKIEVKEFASVMNNAQGNKDIGNEFDKFMSAYQEKVKEKIESKQELQSKEKETTAELDRKSSDQIKESIKLSGVSTNNEDKVLKHTTDKSETTTSAKENNELNEKNKKVFGKFSGKVVKERESKINRSDAKDPDNPKSPSK
ncbi:hypothetical protein H1Q59_07005, partial [Holosporaceae bacterium 'Namur']|nr:hypothetical protein [Holosporaceae bacterium 'Namur']